MFRLKGVYLLAYNAASMLGWGLVFLTCWTEVISIIKADGDLTSVTNGSFWQKPVDYVPYDLGVTLTWVQTAASMEIIHAVLGLVGASPMTTALQVFSRVWVVWAVFLVAPQSTTSFFTLLCITSWASVEVPRYGYLATKELAKLFASKDGESSAEAPYFLKWIRYSLFAVLYPTGITGELGCMYQTYLYLQENPVMVPIKIQPELPPIVSIPLMWLLVGVALTYVQGAPTMYGHMNKQRAKYLGTGSKSKKE